MLKKKIKMWVFIHVILSKTERQKLKDFDDLWRRLS